MPAEGRGGRLREKMGIRAPKPHAARRVYLKEVDVAQRRFPFFRGAWKGIAKALCHSCPKIPLLRMRRQAFQAAGGEIEKKR
ncbi:hypothetical protein EDM56_15670 [Brevibacillus fluminis]|uniref:Uncharacterized protein n=1 Tax=Brevibacillus fluminis TaxID=511487 RepID=A0A3M8DIC8_9BACL|nr:hypothetical protein EDM56_15670 [Brevibacillus fluminis]